MAVALPAAPQQSATQIRHVTRTYSVSGKRVRQVQLVTGNLITADISANHSRAHSPLAALRLHSHCTVVVIVGPVPQYLDRIVFLVCRAYPRHFSSNVILSFSASSTLACLHLFFFF